VAYNRLPPDHWIRWPAVLRAVRPREVQEAASLAFGSRGAATVLVGPLSRQWLTGSQHGTTGGEPPDFPRTRYLRTNTHIYG